MNGGETSNRPAPGSSPAAPAAPASPAAPAVDRRSGLHRRRVLAGAGLFGLGAGAGTGVTMGTQRLLPERADPVEAARRAALAPVTGDGVHQPGIAERAPAHLVFTAYDLTAADPAAARAALGTVLRAWTDGGRTLMRGASQSGASQSGASQSGAVQIGVAGVGREAAGLGSAGLTVTVGIGAAALRRAGLDARLPGPLADIPALPGDRLEATRGGGDLAVQVCAEDPMVAFAAARQLGRLAADLVRPRWVQRGFRRTAAAAADPTATPRNLMGQLDGTNNPRPGSAQFDLAVWAAGGPAWMRGGTYLVCRRIRMLLESWERLTEDARGEVVGRRIDDGAPLSAPPAATGGGEDTASDFAARGPDGRLLIAENAHIRLSNPQFHGGIAMFRRGYSYDDGLDATGEPDSGLFFLAFQADPRTAFVPVQRTLAASDALNTFIRHTASALFAVPPAPPAGGYLGQSLLEEA
ncbi:Dyp-type peroxidase family [Frankia torreyi]|uniref:Dyp-type peroxidase family n=2 Tax=Frankia torreyi TaxID=1856 RepID=A0A0D8BG25_9ACTN|nr:MULTISPECIES: Dyp-type peroxidase [unclassified Frankia]KJE23015.1 Dyp-type peroxidase family [Frankia torreyi]KQM05178.1 Dyp-type peroxidase family [Frankia sp. CpI1-P]